LRDALEDGDVGKVSAIGGDIACKDASCLDPLARMLGSKTGFDVAHPDQASAGAVAILLVRDHRGDLVPPNADVWLQALGTAAGEGADSLRLAVAHGMSDLAPRIGKAIDDEAEAKSVVHDVALVLPGACETYVAMAAAASVDAMGPELRPDHAPCVQHDLERKDGPGAAYGYGVWRAGAAIGALWKDEARALRAGLDGSSSGARSVLEPALVAIDAASAKMAFKRVTAADTGSWTKEMQAVHGLPGAPSASGSGAPPAPPAPSR
jgi:hypothetical protein